MDLHVVLKLEGGFAREDAPTPAIVGAFTDLKIAGQVRVLAGQGARLQTITVDQVPAHLIDSAKELGLAWFTATPADAETKPTERATSRPRP